MLLSHTYNDQPSGVYWSQVTDVGGTQVGPPGGSVPRRSRDRRHYLRFGMSKLANKQKGRKTPVRPSVPKRPKRRLPEVRKFAGAVPGMADWALEEVRRMRDEW